MCEPGSRVQTPPFPQLYGDAVRFRLIIRIASQGQTIGFRWQLSRPVRQLGRLAIPLQSELVGDQWSSFRIPIPRRSVSASRRILCTLASGASRLTSRKPMNPVFFVQTFVWNGQGNLTDT